MNTKDTLEIEQVLKETVFEIPRIERDLEKEYSELKELWCSGKNHKCIVPIENFTKGHVISNLRNNRKSGMCKNCKKIDLLDKPFRGEIKLNIVLDKKQFDIDEIVLKSMGIVYFVSDFNRVKIGISDNLFQFAGKRFTNMQSCSPNRLHILGVIQTTDYRHLEKQLHNDFKQYHSHGEWFNLCDEIKEYINKNCFSFTMPNRYFGENHLTTQSILSDDIGY